MPNIINVSNRLPVTVGETIKKSSGGLVAALEGLSLDHGELKWIGWPGKAIDEPDQRALIEHTLAHDYGFTPVFLTDEQVQAFYEGFSNSTLWPLLHYMPSKFRYNPAWWEAYKSVNAMYAEKVVSIASDGDIVWVHDYQLMLVPAMIKERMPSLRVGFFLHTPFPSYEVFRCHPKSKELAMGVLGADLIGFHTFGYMRHFRSAILRILGIESEMTRIRHGGHCASIGVYPIGINARKFDEQLTKPEHAAELARIQKENDGKQLVLSVERMDYTKGIVERLDAIEMYLQEHEDHEHIKFIFVSVPSREGVPQYQALREEVESRIGRINGKYATLHNSPIHFIHGSIEFKELCALYALADVAIVTPLRDGMNLVAKEYIACQGDDPGVLVLSEFAGAAEELFNALIVNPYDAQAVAGAMEQGLAMSRRERQERMAPMRQRVMQFDAQAWARSFLKDLSAIEIHSEDKTSINDAKAQLTSAIAQGGRIAMFLDYDGTLRELERDPDQARPNDAVRRLLDRLRNCDIDVTLISGRRTDDLETWFGEYPFGLIAEHGAFVRKPSHSDWQQMDAAVNYKWKAEILKLLRQFQDQTPGSFVEEKRTSLVWHYRKSDPEFGEYKARLLAGDLAVLAANEPVVIRQGEKIVEIAAAQISKGAAVMSIAKEEHYDLILCAGDDVTDESMFRVELPNLLTIKVGLAETVAKIRMYSPGQFRRFLENTVQCKPQRAGAVSGA
jgi:trehalose 6-phosphate synthase/phosphatase